MPETSNNYLAAFSNCHFSTKIQIISLIFVYSSIGFFSNGIPLLFKEPLIYCTNEITNQVFECSEFIACSNYESHYDIDRTTGSLSITTQYSLICQKAYEKRWTLTCMFLGLLASAFSQIFFIFDSSKRKLLLFFGGTCLSVSLFLMLCVDWFNISYSFMPWLFFLGGVGALYINTHSFVFINENFKGELAGFALLMLSLVKGLVGMVFVIISYLFNADWRVFTAAGLFLSLGSGLVFSFTKIQKTDRNDLETKIFNNYEDIEEKEEEEENNKINKTQNFSLFSYFKDIWLHRIIRKNFIIYTLVWSFMATIYQAQYIELESVGGNVYINTIIFCFLEAVTSFFSGVLLKKYTSENILKFSLFVEGIFLVFFLFAPISLKDVTNFLTVYFFIFCIIITKILNMIIHLMVYMSLTKMLTDKYEGFYVIFSRSFSRILMVFIPSLNYFIRSLQTHPFVFYGVGLLFFRYLITFCNVVEEDDRIINLLSDAKIGNLDKTVIALASTSVTEGFTHEDMFRRVKVCGVSKSEIYHHSKKISPDRIVENIKGLNLNSKLLKKFNFSKSQNIRMHDIKSDKIKGIL